MWRQGACRLLLLTILELPLVRSQNCPPTSLLMEVGTEKASVPVPQLREGEKKRWPCGEFFEGYDSFLEVFCVGGLLQGDSSRCTPKGCKSGQKAPVYLNVGTEANITLYATLVHDLAHEENGRVPCDSILEGHRDVIELSCKRGAVKADAGKCRPAFKGASTVWRLVNADALPGTWRVFELSFYLNPDCVSERIEGTPVVSSEDQDLAGWKRFAFDRDYETAWSSHCELGCMADTAWVGLMLPQPSLNVRCVQLRQSQVRCCSSDRVRLEVWDGNQFQSMGMWDTSSMEAVRHSFQLPVPITCKTGLPEGEGVIHDCDGPPVVGRQAGSECTAECQPGYYGTPSTYACGRDGKFTGEPPTCYELTLWYNISGFVLISSVLVIMAWQYKFWCMFKKVRLTDEEVTIPGEMKGKFLEHGGRNVWEDLVGVIRNKEKLEDEVIGKRIQDDVHKAAQAQTANIVHAVAQVNPEGSAFEETTEDYMDEVANMVMVHGKLKEKPPQTDGLCTPCQDPDLFWACICCPICRIADTWHTLGKPRGLTYLKVFLMYLFCPCLWPCFNFYGRLRLRMIFGIPIEPHRDFLAHCCCLCCCSPCAICQEARLADAPTRLFAARRKQRDALERVGEL